MLNLRQNIVGEVFMACDFHTLSSGCMFTDCIAVFRRLHIAFVRIIYNEIVKINRIKWWCSLLQLSLCDWSEDYLHEYLAVTSNGRMNWLHKSWQKLWPKMYMPSFWIFHKLSFGWKLQAVCGKGANALYFYLISFVGRRNSFTDFCNNHT